jgi:hypothetical protein
VDRAISEESSATEYELAARTDDAVFLRRVWLDLVGDIPTAGQVTAFVLDPSPEKREHMIRQLLDDPHYGQNWARYWRDVIFFRALDEQQSLQAVNALEVDLADQLNANRPWSEIAEGFVTAQGDVREQGNTAIVVAQEGRTEETTAEISRILLGVQIQCAQCHDHPYDRWKREQFHELAAFFPRVGVRPVNLVNRRSFEVFGSDRFAARRRGDNDTRPEPEHLMPDLENPGAPGATMQPRFFLTGAELPVGSTDRERREQLADWLTSNEWFAIALVNRVWAELVGEGFYEPIDDIGPDRTATAPKALRVLATYFEKSNYDLKWLMRTICQTEAYQRESRPRRDGGGTAFAANVPQPLRSDQLFNALYTALALEEAPPAGRSNPRRNNDPRRQFAEVFGYDPSIAREEISSSIPQVLALMNSAEVQRAVSARSTQLLGKLLGELPDDSALVEELFLRCLSRLPTSGELNAALEYRRESASRGEAFEDLLWSLVNTAEFQHRR